MRIKIIFLIFGTAMFLASCSTDTSSSTATHRQGMIKVTILYPNEEGKTFDMDYYSNNHMPMLASLFGDSLKKLEIDEGLSGRTPDDQIPYLAIGYLYFDNISAYQNSFGPHAEQIRGDIPNYTDIQPIVQISKVLQ